MSLLVIPRLPFSRPDALKEKKRAEYPTLRAFIRAVVVPEMQTKQVDHDELNQADIPVQRKACRDFAEKMGWVIVNEEQATGVSGYKVSANDRDKLQLIKKRAEQGKFDILLVFMFDRLGRKSDETPFVVEFAKLHPFDVNPQIQRLFGLLNRVAEDNGFPKFGSVRLGGASDAGVISEAGIPVLCSCGPS